MSQAGPARERLFGMIFGYAPAQAVRTAARLDLGELLAEGPASTAEVARRTGAGEDGLRRLLVALANLGVLERLGPDRFGGTELSELLRGGRPGSLKASALFFPDVGYRAWGELEHSVRTGEPAARCALGDDLYGYLAAHPEPAAAWDQLMSDTVRDLVVAAGTLDAYAWPEDGTLVDVGGGRGVFLAALLRARPRLRGILFDQAHVVGDAPALLAQAGVAHRCEVRGGDFFRQVPEGDHHLLARVLFNWDDAAALAILQACRRSLRGGRLIVVEPLAQPWDTPARSQVGDLNNLVMTGGRVRSPEEHRRLLEQAGFALEAVLELPRGYDLVEARLAG